MKQNMVVKINDKIEDDYLQWLIDTYTDFDNEEREKSYMFLSEILFKTPFLVKHPMDQNRFIDGLGLRKEYNDRFVDPRLMVGVKNYCSLLEMMIALSKRMEYQIPFNSKLKTSKQCMLLFLCNLELVVYNDAYISEISSDEELREIFFEINNILLILNNRKYDKNGNGGLFPLKNLEKKDQKRVEIWYQMCAFLLENFDYNLCLDRVKF